MTITWVAKYKGGVEWGKTDLGIDFNWHPILMTLSLIFLYGNGEKKLNFLLFMEYFLNSKATNLDFLDFCMIYFPT